MTDLEDTQPLEQEPEVPEGDDQEAAPEPEPEDDQAA